MHGASHEGTYYFMRYCSRLVGDDELGVGSLSENDSSLFSATEGHVLIVTQNREISKLQFEMEVRIFS